MLIDTSATTLLKEQRENPTLGILLIFRYRGGATGYEGAHAAPAFEGLSWRRAYTKDEAKSQFKREARVSAAGTTYEYGWIEPLEKPSPMVLSTPFERVALAKFADIRRIAFQRAQFKEWGGFDTKGTDGPIDASKWAEKTRAFRFLVLRVPSEIS